MSKLSTIIDVLVAEIFRTHATIQRCLVFICSVKDEGTIQDDELAIKTFADNL